MNETIHVIFRDSFCDSLRTFNMYIVKGEVLGGVFAANKVEDNVRVSYAFFDRLCVSQVVLNERNSSKISCHFEMSFGHLFSVGDHNIAPSPRQSVDDVSSQEARGSKHRHCVSSEG